MQDIGYSEMNGEGGGPTQSALMYKLLDDFNCRLQSHVEGRSLDVPRNHVGPGAAINRTIYGGVHGYINSALEQPNVNEIKLTLVNLPGYRNSLFPNQDAIDIAIRQLIENYREPLFSSLEAIKTIFIQAIEDAAKLYFGTYPTLLNRMLCLINDSILRNETETVGHLMSFVDAHKAFINTKHPNFLKSLKDIQRDDPAFGQVSLGLIRRSTDTNVNNISSSSSDADSGPTVHQEGKLTFLPDEVEVIVVIDGESLTFGSSDDSDAAIPATTFDLKDCKCNSYVESGDQKRFVIQKVHDEEPLFGNEGKVEFLATQSSELNSWTKAFADLGILQRTSANPTGPVARPPLRQYEKVLCYQHIILVAFSANFIIIAGGNG